MDLKKALSASEVADSIIDANKNANKFLELLADLEKTNTKVVVDAIEACVRVCCHWIEKDYVGEGGADDDSAEEKFKGWVGERVEGFFDELCARFSDEKDHIKSASWLGTEGILKASAEHTISTTHNLYNFPTPYLNKILSTLISSETDASSLELLQTHLHHLCAYDDARYFTIKTLNQLLGNSPSSFNLDNIFIILQSLHMPLTSSSALPPSSSSSSSSSSSPLLNNFFVNKELIDVTMVTKYSDERENRRMFSAAWISFLNMTMPPSLITSILSVIDTEVMPFMTNPLQLADYLVMFYRMGGKLSMAALGGLFVLMNNYNLEYPDFYSHLYSQLLHHPHPPSFLTSTFLSRLDLFLTSTHLPSTLVASFIKRLSRLALISPSITQPFLICLIINLTIRHPNCSILMGGKKDGVDLEEELSTDPFNNHEDDPMKTNALASSLWEIKFLQKHKLITISTLADKINNNNRCELNNDKYINLDYSILSKKESKSEPSKVPIRGTEPTFNPHPSAHHLYFHISL